MGPGGEAHPLEGGLHQRVPGAVQAAEVPDHGGGHIGIAGDAGAGKAGGLDGPGGVHRVLHVGGALRRLLPPHGGILHRGTLTRRSIRSSRGPEIFSTYLATSRSEQVHRPEGCPRQPHGQGFMAATSWNRAGRCRVPPARVTVTRPSSSGWRRVSMPSGGTRAARPETAPRCGPGITLPAGAPVRRRSGRGRERYDGARGRGRARSSPVPPGSVPAMEWILVASSASSGLMSGRMEGSRLASMLLPDPGGPISSRLWEPAAAISMARRAPACPITSRRSGPAASSASGTQAVAGRRRSSPRRWRARAPTSGTP